MIKTIVKIFIEENIVIVMTVYSHKSITSGSGRDHIVVGFTTICAQSVPITTKVLGSNPFITRCTQYNIM